MTNMREFCEFIDYSISQCKRTEIDKNARMESYASLHVIYVAIYFRSRIVSCRNARGWTHRH